MVLTKALILGMGNRAPISVWTPLSTGFCRGVMFKPREFTTHRAIEHFCTGTLSLPLESEALYLPPPFVWPECGSQWPLAKAGSAAA